MTNHHQFTRVEFRRFKAFKSFGLSLRHFNILVGPNNAGKSTILTAFRILSAGMRRAARLRPEFLPGPVGVSLGYVVDLEAMSVAEENLFYNYDDSEAATVTFTLSNKNQLISTFRRGRFATSSPRTRRGGSLRHHCFGPILMRR